MFKNIFFEIFIVHQLYRTDNQVDKRLQKIFLYPSKYLRVKVPESSRTT
jgi:hypothetical protein